MKRRLVFVLAAVVLLVSLWLTRASAEEFSADMVSTASGQTFQGKVYMGRDKVRMENPQSISITRIDKKVLWVLMPAEHKYVEQPFDTSTFIADTKEVEGEMGRKLIGREPVNGQMTDKYEVTYSRNGQTSTVLQWIAPGISIPVKSASPDGAWVIEYRNIRMGSQPASIFEIPAGYQKMSFGSPLSNEQLKNMVDELF